MTVVVSLAMASGAARATGWTPAAVPPAETPNAAFADVSCVSLNVCMAVGTQLNGIGILVPLAERRTASGWTALPVQPIRGDGATVLSAVACPSAEECVAVGHAGGYGSGPTIPVAGVWRGADWQVRAITMMPYAQGGVLTGVSCLDASRCEAVGSTGAVTSTRPLTLGWNGRRWVTQAPPPAAVGGLGRVSCTSPSFCLATGDGSLARFDGVSWTAETDSASLGGHPVDVSCWASEQCGVAVDYDGGGGALDRLSQGAWSGITLVSAGASGGADIYHASCVASGVCTSIVEQTCEEHCYGDYGPYSVQTSDPAISPYGDSYAAVSAGAFSGLSCVTATTCALVHSGWGTALAERFNGRRWADESAPTPPGDVGDASLAAIACPAARQCLAVGTASIFDGLIERWDGRHWHWTATNDRGKNAGASLTGIACAATRSCTAVGSGGIERWNGGRWRQLPGPAGAGALKAISCPAPAWCLAVGLARFRRHQYPPATAISDADGQRTGPPLPKQDTDGDLAAVSCWRPRACVATGAYFTRAAIERPLALRFTRSGWVAMQLPKNIIASELELLGISCPSADDCVAVGSDGPTAFDGGGGLGSVIAAWDGHRWHREAAPDADVNLMGITCRSVTRCVAVGRSATRPVTLTWNGTRWQRVTEPLPRATVPTGIACPPSGPCVAVGNDKTGPVSAVQRG